jgi:fumarylacetoacetate (FAA) hydrolase
VGAAPGLRARAASFTTHRIMKLATLKDGTRDGQLAVVSRDLKTRRTIATGIASHAAAACSTTGSFMAPQLH